MDMTETIAPKSDQINAEDLLTGPRTFTVAKVEKGSSEQPVNVHLVEYPGRPYRPSKTMRRVMVSVWGAEAANYTGKRFTLYRDPEVTFGRDKVGGIKISHMSDLDKPVSLMLTATRGKRAEHTVQPLTAEAPAQGEPTAEQVAECVIEATLRDWWKSSGKERRAQIEARVAELAAEPDADPNPHWTDEATA